MAILLNEALRMSKQFLIGRASDGTEVTIKRDIYDGSIVTEMSPYLVGTDRKLLGRGPVTKLLEHVRETTYRNKRIPKWESFPVMTELHTWDAEDAPELDRAIVEAINLQSPHDYWGGITQIDSFSFFQTNKLDTYPEVRSYMNTEAKSHMVCAFQNAFLNLATTQFGDVLVPSQTMYCVILKRARGDFRPGRFIDFAGFLVS